MIRFLGITKARIAGIVLTIYIAHLRMAAQHFSGKKFVDSLSGTGNFLMNQIGHLPIIGVGGMNRASPEEMQLCVNTLMWISQRKQCEVCAADQADQQMTHFVHRVNAANAKKILTALANGIL